MNLIVSFSPELSDSDQKVITSSIAQRFYLAHVTTQIVALDGYSVQVIYQGSGSVMAVRAELEAIFARAGIPKEQFEIKFDQPSIF